jgi:hypothetical protein
MILEVAVAIQAFESVTVTVYVPIDNELIAAVLNAPGIQR